MAPFFIMANVNRFKRSVLDRLLAEDLEAGTGIVLTYSLEQLRDAVARDVESLLNSRAIWDSVALKGYPNVSRSILSFGIKDFVGKVLTNSEDQRTISHSLVQAIETHEPRLKNVRVVFHDSNHMHSTNSLAFSIHALLMIHPSSEPVSFDAVLQPNLSRIELRTARFIPMYPAITKL